MRQRSGLSHSRSLLPFENLEWRPALFAQLLLCGRGCVFLQKLLPVPKQFVGIVTKCSHILKYADVNPDCYPKIFLSLISLLSTVNNKILCL